MLRCNACMVGFRDSLEHRHHYRLNWHRLNSKRRTQNLPPVSQQAYEKRYGPEKPLIKEDCGSGVEETKAEVVASASKSERVEGGQEDPPTTTTATDDSIARPASNPSSANSTSTPATKAPSSDMSLAEKLFQKRKQEREKLGAQQTPNVDVDSRSGEDDSDQDGDIEEEEEEEEIILDEETCLFCNYTASTTLAKDDLYVDLLQHMKQAHSFVIPDREFCTDVSGMVMYLKEKIHLGHVCIFCNRIFTSPDGVLCHMSHDRGVSHCKVKYEEGFDLHEFEDFYDFSTTWGAGVGGQLQHGAGTIDTTDPASVDLPLDSSGLLPLAPQVTPSGELFLPPVNMPTHDHASGGSGGKTIGHRDYARYYRQRHNAPLSGRNLIEDGGIGVGGVRGSTNEDAVRCQMDEISSRQASQSDAHAHALALYRAQTGAGQIHPPSNPFRTKALARANGRPGTAVGTGGQLLALSGGGRGLPNALSKAEMKQMGKAQQRAAKWRMQMGVHTNKLFVAKLQARDKI